MPRARPNRSRTDPRPRPLSWQLAAELGMVRVDRDQIVPVDQAYGRAVERQELQLARLRPRTP